MLNDRIGPKLQSIICATTATTEGTVASDWSFLLIWPNVAPVNTGESSTVGLSSRSAAEKFRRNVIRMIDLIPAIPFSCFRSCGCMSSFFFSLFTRLTGKDDIRACPIVSGTFLSAFFLSNPILDLKEFVRPFHTQPKIRPPWVLFYYFQKTKHFISEEEEDNDGAVWSSCIVPGGSFVRNYNRMCVCVCAIVLLVSRSSR
jgi:hypothetical protein